MIKFELEILEKISRAIEKYSMFDKSDTLIIALSGGKDSLLTTIALKELGYSVKPVIVDMGYKNDWSKNIKNIISTLKIESHIIDARNENLNCKINQQNQKTVLEGLKFLENNKPNRNITPCTMCYNIKLILICSYANNLNINKIIFGHHGSDSITSFLKSALMYIDRWDYAHEIYDRFNFYKLIEKEKLTFLKSYEEFVSTNFSKRIEELTNSKLISTDEPPVQKYFQNEHICIYRPLFFLYEDAIISFKELNNIKTLGSECSHSLARDTYTPREMIQYELIYSLFKNIDGNLIQDWFLNLILKGLNKDGTLIFNSRNERAKILGNQYKTTKGCEIKL